MRQIKAGARWKNSVWGVCPKEKFSISFCSFLLKAALQQMSSTKPMESQGWGKVEQSKWQVQRKLLLLKAALQPSNPHVSTKPMES
jgi:hypothetical protein